MFVGLLDDINAASTRRSPWYQVKAGAESLYSAVRGVKRLDPDALQESITFSLVESVSNYPPLAMAKPRRLTQLF